VIRNVLKSTCRLAHGGGFLSAPPSQACSFYWRRCRRLSALFAVANACPAAGAEVFNIGDPVTAPRREE